MEETEQTSQLAQSMIKNRHAFAKIFNRLVHVVANKTRDSQHTAIAECLLRITCHYVTQSLIFVDKPEPLTFSLALVPGAKRVSLEDVLQTFAPPGLLPGDAYNGWYVDEVIDQIAAAYSRTLHFYIPTVRVQSFFSRDPDCDWDAVLERAKENQDCSRKYQLTYFLVKDMPADTRTVHLVYNVGSHWVYAKICVDENDAGRITVRDSLTRNPGSGGGVEADYAGVRRELRKIAALVALTPGLKWPTLDWNSVGVAFANCFQQENSHDCGAFAAYALIREMQPDLPAIAEQGCRLHTLQSVLSHVPDLPNWVRNSIASREAELEAKLEAEREAEREAAEVQQYPVEDIRRYFAAGDHAGTVVTGAILTARQYNVSRPRWTPSEDKLITAGFANGATAHQIAFDHFSDTRTANAITGRFRRMNMKADIAAKDPEKAEKAREAKEAKEAKKAKKAKKAKGAKTAKTAKKAKKAKKAKEVPGGESQEGETEGVEDGPVDAGGRGSGCEVESSKATVKGKGKLIVERAIFSRDQARLFYNLKAGWRSQSGAPTHMIFRYATAAISDLSDLAHVLDDYRFARKNARPIPWNHDTRIIPINVILAISLNDHQSSVVERAAGGAVYHWKGEAAQVIYFSTAVRWTASRNAEWNDQTLYEKMRCCDSNMGWMWQDPRTETFAVIVLFAEDNEDDDTFGAELDMEEKRWDAAGRGRGVNSMVLLCLPDRVLHLSLRQLASGSAGIVAEHEPGDIVRVTIDTASAEFAAWCDGRSLPIDQNLAGDVLSVLRAYHDCARNGLVEGMELEDWTDVTARLHPGE
jgi:hypothetical protein